MTIITVNTLQNRLTLEQRRRLAEGLTDAVLVPELGQHAPSARVGFQVHFAEFSADRMAIGGKLLSDQTPQPDVITIHIAVMAAAWPAEVRADVIRRVLACLSEVCGLKTPPTTWWVTFQVIDEGSWGSRGDVLSILNLLGSGVFTAERIAEIRKALS
jgi:phenylpyruvate tautomerase PptA (4-oxalocrotonate tautomerase family)